MCLSDKQVRAQFDKIISLVPFTSSISSSHPSDPENVPCLSHHADPVPFSKRSPCLPRTSKATLSVGITHVLATKSDAGEPGRPGTLAAHPDPNVPERSTRYRTMSAVRPGRTAPPKSNLRSAPIAPGTCMTTMGISAVPRTRVGSGSRGRTGWAV